MSKSEVLTALWTGAFFLVHLGVIARVILRPHRAPAPLVAWVLFIIVRASVAPPACESPVRSPGRHARPYQGPGNGFAESATENPRDFRPPLPTRTLGQWL